MMLNLQTYEPIPEIAPAQPENRKNPLLAMLLSIIFPGLGHMYLGSRRNAAWLAGFEVLMLLTIAGGEGQTHATALMSAPSLYLFAIIDAYFRAREWNAGVTDWMVGANPRVTAILNLLTKGFGYFYLGDRTKGVICFLALSAAQGALLLHENVWTRVLAISLQVAVALDGYRVARDRLFATHPELELLSGPEGSKSANIVDAANPGGFRPQFAIFLFALCGGAMLIVYAASQAMNNHEINSKGTLERGSTGLIYQNTHEGIELTVPADWNDLPPDNMLVDLRGNGASLLVEEKFATYAVNSMLNETQKELHIRHPTATFTPERRKFSGKFSSGIETSYTNQNEVLIHQRIFGVRRGLKILILIESWTHDENQPVFDQIEKSIRLN